MAGAGSEVGSVGGSGWGSGVDFPVVRINDCPVIETDIMPSRLHPQGVGEPGVPPVAPAVANAVFTLTGKRLRSLPLKVV